MSKCITQPVIERIVFIHKYPCPFGEHIRNAKLQALKTRYRLPALLPNPVSFLVCTHLKAPLPPYTRQLLYPQYTWYGIFLQSTSIFYFIGYNPYVLHYSVKMGVVPTPHLHATPTPWAVSSQPCSLIPSPPGAFWWSCTKNVSVHPSRNRDLRVHRYYLEQTFLTQDLSFVKIPRPFLRRHSPPAGR